MLALNDEMWLPAAAASIYLSIFLSLQQQLLQMLHAWYCMPAATLRVQMLQFYIDFGMSEGRGTALCSRGGELEIDTLFL